MNKKVTFRYEWKQEQQVLDTMEKQPFLGNKLQIEIKMEIYHMV